ncbi:hypothetical protein Bresa_03442|uniref:Uncharacterized protein n=1 Tax=Brenneria salicis ATCC 15712 = DSM 30166 TaxID=714314 RepID=A0A366I7G2_9GAMM|nr:hypothetical protein [Brenneria salicis ATCC 15712 = DSM 30166]RBP65127.1 hypothetical protein DES54_1053 [Brenneria salicis ATCC 15712 = DSM 30166]
MRAACFGYMLKQIYQEMHHHISRYTTLQRAQNLVHQRDYMLSLIEAVK